MIPTTDIIATGTPTGWRTAPFWSLFCREKVTGFPDEELLSVYRDYGVIPKASRDDNHNRESDDLSGYQLVTEGALVTNKMKAWQGSIAISRYRGIVSPAYYVYTPQSDECDQFLHYLLRSTPYIGLYGRISKGVRVNQWDLEHEALRNIPVLLPDLPTQRAIADFLDRETARIDLLIEKKQRLVALLGEKRSATITAAVSGQTEVPGVGSRDCLLAEGGGGMKLKWSTDIINGYAFKSEEFTDDGIPIVRQSNLKSGKITHDGRCYPRDQIPTKFMLREGDICIGLSGSIENFGVIDRDDLPCALNQRVGALRVKREKSYFRFVEYFVQSKIFKDHIASNLPSTTIVNIDGSLVGNSPFPDFDLPTQRAIADFLDRETARLQKIQVTTQQSIERLREYRSALITAAVTGQIKVAEWGRVGTNERQLDAIQAEMEH